MVGGAGTDWLNLYLDETTTSFSIRIADQVAAPLTIAPGTSISGFERFDLTLGSGDDRIDLTGMKLAGQNSFNAGEGLDTLVLDARSQGALRFTGFDKLSLDLTGVSGGADVASTHVTFRGFEAGAQYNSRFMSMDVTGGAAADTLAGADGADTLLGAGGADWISGGAGADSLNGGSGRDWLYGGEGKDVLTGGEGADSFVFDADLLLRNVDRITDFVSGSDTIVLGGPFLLPSGALAEDAFHVGSAAADAGDRIIYDPTSGALYYDVDGRGGARQQLFATLDGKPDLTFRDFLIV